MTHVVGVEMTLEPESGLSAAAVTDLIELVVDALDDAGFTPNVSTAGTGHSVRMNVEVLVDGTELRALEVGIAGITKALAHANIEVGLTDVHPSMRVLENA